MARTVKHAKLDSRTARADTKKLKRGRQPHWQELQPRTHLGYQRIWSMATEEVPRQRQ
jgi:hypothetical protein